MTSTHHHNQRSADTETDTPGIVLAIEMSNPGANPQADPQAGPGTGAPEPPHALALWRTGPGARTLLGSCPMERSTRGSDGIMAAVSTLCAGAGINAGEITEIIVSLGPGGYTALRISTTTAKVLAMALGARLIGVPTARVARAAIDPVRLPAMIALASKHEHTHASIVRPDTSIETVGVIGVERLASLEVATIVADRHLPGVFVQGARELGIVIEPIVLDARAMLDASAGIAPTDPVALGPIYAREPDAVTQWRTRHPS